MFVWLWLKINELFILFSLQSRHFCQKLPLEIDAFVWGFNYSWVYLSFDLNIYLKKKKKKKQPSGGNTESPPKITEKLKKEGYNFPHLSELSRLDICFTFTLKIWIAKKDLIVTTSGSRDTFRNLLNIFCQTSVFLQK